MEFVYLGFWSLVAIYLIYKIFRCIRIIPAQDVLIVERLGKYSRSLRAGFHILIPFIDRDAYYHTLKEQSIDVQPQICITHDNVQVKVDGVIYLKIIDPVRASYGIEDFQFAAIQLAQTTMRSVIGTMELDKTIGEKDLINSTIVAAIDQASEPWGIKVNRYEILNIVPPKSVLDAMEKEKKAQIAKRSQVLLSEGERDARINRSLGFKEEAVNKSEGEKQRRINSAEGKATEIEALAVATAKGIEAIAGAISDQGGASAIKLQITKAFIQNFLHVAKESTEILIPADVMNLPTLIANLTEAKKPKA
ncbi:SPFH domain/Band 7 family protein [Leptospira yanagawae serovar Saopaulo str. Sao Paulo = ATCC 700523]|uniref:Paraslipin n=3 Tax=Leptospira TaxID=171 RepID=A0A4Z1AAR2_9LEPT|nr:MULTISPECIES: slipin family protein [Leptospira]EOQ90448.1 SPFH domain/Band 7 family protein [Leptospira yanagawae serovar Saopaulo str. Sao Paulo = ATCC 700523]TGL18896.1 paraslipin [Leptospira yanagawae]TGL74130.1 paraslipin [Leptospira jelokensis]TGL99601.1 paraslipin [Leptospira jelokensis]